jgi:predicted NUDIX family phosphoesterase
MNKDDELVLVVPSDKLFEKGVWQGLKTENLDYYLELIKNNCEFKRRGDVETDNGVQQVIPYILFSFGNPVNGTGKFFAYKYLAKAGEQRLVNDDYQLGVGGHINKEDVNDAKDVVETGMMREWEEEVDFKGKLISKKLVGIINDDSRPVEQVHLGLVYHFVGDSADIQIKETDKMTGKLSTVKELLENQSRSVWSQIVCKNYLSKLV